MTNKRKQVILNWMLNQDKNSLVFSIKTLVDLKPKD